MRTQSIQQVLSKEMVEKIIYYVQDFNFDIDSLLDLFASDFNDLEAYMIEDIKKYIAYVIWLCDNKKPTQNSFEQYVARLDELKLRQKDAYVQENKSKIDDEQKKIEHYKKQLEDQKRFDHFSNDNWSRLSADLEMYNNVESLNDINDDKTILSDEDFLTSVDDVTTLFSDFSEDQTVLIDEDYTVSNFDQSLLSQDEMEALIEDFQLDPTEFTSFQSTNETETRKTEDSDLELSAMFEETHINYLTFDPTFIEIMEQEKNNNSDKSYDGDELTGIFDVIKSTPIKEASLSQSENDELAIEQLTAIDMLNYDLTHVNDIDSDNMQELILDFTPKLGQVLFFDDNEYEIIGMGTIRFQNSNVPTLVLKDYLNDVEMQVRFTKER